MFWVVLFHCAQNVVFFSIRERQILTTWSLVESMWGRTQWGQTHHKSGQNWQLPNFAWYKVQSINASIWNNHLIVWNNIAKQWVSAESLEFVWILIYWAWPVVSVCCRICQSVQHTGMQSKTIITLTLSLLAKSHKVLIAFRCHSTSSFHCSSYV